VSADFEDWTRGLELVTDDMSDFPDWTVAAQVTGGGGGGYASLTGDGQTDTPGELDQAGRFTITDLGMTADFGGAVGPLSPSIIFNTPALFDVTAQGMNVTTSGVTVDAGTGEILLESTNSVQVDGCGFFANLTAAVSYGTGGSGPDQSGGISLRDLGPNRAVNMFVFHGNPTGNISPPAGAGAVCFDTATPKLWGWAEGASSWVGI
jgi:hypothetical protein